MRIFPIKFETFECQELSDELKKKNNRVSSASTTKSIKFMDSESNSKETSSITSILKSRPSTKLSGSLKLELCVK